ncbi:MAG: metal-dependent hydrolase [Planctomycetales bacterium]|nr:metal-dependent hydrolase [Planctomycetales bacterium]
MQLTWYGHSCFLLETDEHKLLVDPFLDENPAAPVKAADVAADFILLTHGHFDHVADAVAIAQRTEATVIANFEIGQWLVKQGLSASKVIGMNTGGALDAAFGRVKMTLAHHSSSLPDGSYGGSPGGYLLEVGGQRLYFAGDTALFLDMKLLGVGGIDLAVLPIGDLFTMGPADSIEAIKMLGARRVVPCHYNTWPPIAQDASQWADSVLQRTAAEAMVLQPGESVEI